MAASFSKLQKPSIGVAIAGLVISGIGLVFGIIILAGSFGKIDWVKSVANVLYGAGMVCSTLGIIFNIIVIFQIKANGEESVRPHVINLILSVVGIILAAVFCAIINK